MIGNKRQRKFQEFSLFFSFNFEVYREIGHPRATFAEKSRAMNDYKLPIIDLLNEEVSSENDSDTVTNMSTVVPIRTLLNSPKFQESSRR